MIQTVVDFVMGNTRHPILVVGIRRVRLDEYPQEVIREAIVNAIAHRDYEDSARPIYVKVFFDRVEVLSPGDLMRPLTVAKLLRGKFEPCSRNPTLAQYLGQLGLMEQRGSGILRMRQTMLNHGLNAPTYAFRDGYFCVTLKGPGSNLGRLSVPDRERNAPAQMEDRLTERQKKMAKVLAKGHPLTSGKCQEMFRISNVTAVRDLAFLVEIGIAKQEGKGRSTRYIFKSDNR
jgi:predicted HTH transcriptional regulator